MEYLELEWPLIVFTFLMCLAGGVFAIQALLALRGKGGKTRFASLVVTVVAFVIGGLGVFLHLEHWERMFNGFGHISSPITHEVIGVVVFAATLVLYFLFMRRSKDGLPPRWCNILALVVGLAMPVLCGRSYMMAADPVWDTVLLLLFYLADALMMGAFAGLIIAKVKKEDDALGTLLLLAAIGAAARLVIIVDYALVIHTMTGSYTSIGYYFDPTLPDSHIIDPASYLHAILTGDLSMGFYLVVLLVGSLVPLGIAIMMKRANSRKAQSSGKGSPTLASAGAALVCTVIGGVVWRCMLYWVCLHVFPYFSLG
jgi:anaerobic dimethyl sulfoxide reductase subunit C (anchor subunit)